MISKNAEKTSVETDAENENPDVAFVTPFRIDLGENGGETVFKTFAEAAAWASAEVGAWNEIIGREKSDKPFEQRIIDAQMHTPKTLCDIARSVLNKQTSVAEGTTLIRRGMTTYLTYACIHSCGTLGKTAAVMYRYEPMLMGLLAGASGSAGIEDTKGYDNASDAESFTFGFMLSLQFRIAIPQDMMDSRFNETAKKINTLSRRLLPSETTLKHMDEEQAVLRRDLDESMRLLHAYKQEVEQCLSRLITEAKQTSEYAANELWNQMNVLQTDHERQLASLRQSVSSRIRYGTAMDYWNKQLVVNQTKTNQTTLWFVISGLFAVFTLVMVTIGLAKFAFLKEMPVVTVPLFAMIIGITGVLSFMLLQSKTRYEKAAQLAQDKVSLLETLASLETEGKVKDGARDVLLEKIFLTNFPASGEKTEKTPTVPAAEESGEKTD